MAQPVEDDFLSPSENDSADSDRPLESVSERGSQPPSEDAVKTDPTYGDSDRVPATHLSVAEPGDRSYLRERNATPDNGKKNMETAATVSARSASGKIWVMSGTPLTSCDRVSSQLAVCAALR